MAAGGVPSAAGFVVPHALSAVPAVNMMKANAATRTCVFRCVGSVMCVPSIAMSSARNDWPTLMSSDTQY